jgi:Replication protein A C terminal
MQVVHHNLSVMFEHMYLTQGQNMGVLGNAMAPQALQMHGGVPPMAMANAMQPAGGGGGGGQVCYDALMALLHGPAGHGEFGLEISEACRLLGAQFSEPAVRQAAALAVEQGAAYTTQDDQSIRSTALA